MRPLLLTLFGIFLFSFSVLSQSHLKDIMDRLPDPKKKSIPTLIPIKSSLPCRFYRNLSSSFIGISDIGVDSTTAYQQAYLRALSVFSLSNGMARGMSDFYNNSKGKQISSNYEEICEVKTSCNVPLTAVKISDTIWLKSGELVLFLTVDSTKVNENKRVKLNNSVIIYYKENENDGSRKIVSKIRIENKLSFSTKKAGHSEKLTYIVNNNRWLTKDIIFDNHKIQTEQYKIFYSAATECLKDSTGYKNAGSNTLDGLWYALINNTYQQLSAQLKDQFQKVKKVGDKYNDQLISLNRESGIIHFNCTLLDGVYFENKFFTQIKVSY